MTEEIASSKSSQIPPTQFLGISQFEYYPILLVTQALSLPLYWVAVIFLVLLRFVAGYSMYLFESRYLDVVLGRTNSGVRTFTPIVSCIIYMYFPYNVLGDNFPELAIMRSFAPIYLLLVLELLERRRAFLFAPATGLLALLIFWDPRALIYITPIAFVFLILPKLHVISKAKIRSIVILVFFLHVGLSFLLSGVKVILPRTPTTVSSMIHVPMVQDAFRYGYATLSNVLRGVDFESTYWAYDSLVQSLPRELSFLIPTGQFVLATLAFMTIITSGSKSRRIIAYLMPPTVAMVAILLVFSRIVGDPLFVKTIFSNLAEFPPLVKTFFTMYRTPRFTDIFLSIAFSVFAPIALPLLHDGNGTSESGDPNQLKIAPPHMARHDRKALLSFLVIVYLFVSFSGSWFFLSDGNLLYVNRSDE